jgi:hypothetical protein
MSLVLVMPSSRIRFIVLLDRQPNNGTILGQARCNVSVIEPQPRKCGPACKARRLRNNDEREFDAELNASNTPGRYPMPLFCRHALSHGARRIRASIKLLTV